MITLYTTDFLLISDVYDNFLSVFVIDALPMSTYWCSAGRLLSLSLPKRSIFIAQDIYMLIMTILVFHLTLSHLNSSPTYPTTRFSYLLEFSTWIHHKRLSLNMPKQSST